MTPVNKDRCLNLIFWHYIRRLEHPWALRQTKQSPASKPNYSEGNYIFIIHIFCGNFHDGEEAMKMIISTQWRLPYICTCMMRPLQRNRDQAPQKALAIAMMVLALMTKYDMYNFSPLPNIQLNKDYLPVSLALGVPLNIAIYPEPG